MAITCLNRTITSTRGEKREKTERDLIEMFSSTALNIDDDKKEDLWLIMSMTTSIFVSWRNLHASTKWHLDELHRNKSDWVDIFLGIIVFMKIEKELSFVSVCPWWWESFVTVFFLFDGQHKVFVLRLRFLRGWKIFSFLFVRFYWSGFT